MARAERRGRAELTLGDERIAWVHVRVAGRRHVHLTLDGGEVHVRTPWHCARAIAERALRDHIDWVRERLRIAEARRRRSALGDGARLPLLDETLVLRVRGRAQLDLFSPPAPTAVRREGRRLIVDAARIGADSLRESLGRWYRERAAELLPARVRACAERAGHSARRISVGSARRRWGSCNARGHIRLNWRLLLLPSSLVDYVVAHEVAHLAHLDHSAAFWREVERLVPDYRERRARLRAVEEPLML